MSEAQATVFLWLAFFSLVAACLGVWAGRHTSRQKATLDFIADYNNDSRVSDGFRVIRKKPQDLSTPADRDAFLFLMNKFEILAMGLKNGIYDKRMVSDTYGRDLREIYAQSKPLIEHVRVHEADSEAFCEFEKLANAVKTKNSL